MLLLFLLLTTNVTATWRGQAHESHLKLLSHLPKAGSCISIGLAWKELLLVLSTSSTLQCSTCQKQISASTVTTLSNATNSPNRFIYTHGQVYTGAHTLPHIPNQKASFLLFCDRISLCSPGWLEFSAEPDPEPSYCLSLPTARIIYVHHHT